MCKTFEKCEPVVRTTVVNLRTEDYDVYIGRAGHGQSGYFGNPHPVGFCKICNTTHKRGESIAAFKADFEKRIRSDPEYKEKILALRGQTLGCFCKPEACHGDVIADYVDGKFCSNCEEPVPNPSWDNRRYHLCDMCISCSIIGYDAPKTIGIVGSRRRDSSQDYKKCFRAFERVYRHGDTLVSGGCPKGGDAFAEQIARDYDIPIKIHYPDWERHGRSAGLRRNGDIAADADILIAVVADDRRGGTEDTIRKFGDKKPLVVVHTDDIIYNSPKPSLLADLEGSE